MKLNNPNEFNILIIEDIESKFNDIRREVCKLGNIKHISNLRDAIIHINENSFIDFIILDMGFKICEDGEYEEDCGIHFLFELTRKELDIPVIICSSSSKYETKSKTFSNVKGFIEYSPFSNISQLPHMVIEAYCDKNNILYISSKIESYDFNEDRKNSDYNYKKTPDGKMATFAKYSKVGAYSECHNAILHIDDKEKLLCPICNAYAIYC